MKRNVLVQTILGCTAAGLLAFVAGCATSDSGSASTATQPAPVAEQPAAQPMAAVTAPAPQKAAAAIRINAGGFDTYTDPNGNVWMPDQGFVGGDIVERPGQDIANTQQPDLYRSERYAMDSFSCDVPNGKYLAKLHFAETFEGIMGPGDRVFSFNVQGREFKDFDVWVKAGGANRAFVETVPVEVTDGKFKITFAFNVENPEINAIELIPQ